ncbi:Polysaccharide biosynthesis protein [hydrothermal vent metagenome]|uniref:Polysaccharide biosynthesis protein n=1 Tax=hydrothermal vent metagenome TaxID=652676 RepID=A0A3B0XEJ7_9ZZZZ
MLWLSIGTVIAKISSFLSLIVLGWYLSKEEFALYALAYSSSIVFIALRNGGIQQLIIQRGASKYNLTINLYTRYALLFNVLAMFLIFIASPFIVNIYDDDILYILLFVIAVSLPLGTAGLLHRSKLAIDLRFSDVAKFDAFSSIVRNVSSAILAISGFGVISFILPLIFVALFEWFYGKYKTQVTLLKRKSLSARNFKYIFSSSRWIIMTCVAISISLQGDYFIIGLFESKETVGLYFFGFQITIAIAVVISQGMQSVVMPVMSRIKNDVSRQSEAFNKMLVILLICIAYVAFQMCLFSEYFIHFIWAGKWDDTISVVQILSLSLIATVLVPLGKSVLESCAKWKTVSYLMMVEAFGVIASAALGAALGGLVSIAIAVSVFRFCYGVFYILFVSRVLTLSLTRTFNVIMLVLLSGLLAYIVSIKAVVFLDIQSFWGFLSAKFILFTALYVFMLLVLQYHNLKLAKNYFYSMVKR